MPTYERSASFKADYQRLDQRERQQVRTALRRFIEDLAAIEEGTATDFRPSLRVKAMRANPGVFELTWEAADGRATFDFGPPREPGKRHVRWRRIGTHVIFRDP